VTLQVSKPWSANLEDASRWLQAIAHPLRMRIIELLAAQEYHTTELVKSCEALWSTALWHLKILEENGFVIKR